MYSRGVWLNKSHLNTTNSSRLSTTFEVMWNKLTEIRTSNSQACCTATVSQRGDWRIPHRRRSIWTSCTGYQLPTEKNTTHSLGLGLFNDVTRVTLDRQPEINLTYKRGKKLSHVKSCASKTKVIMCEKRNETGRNSFRSA